MVTDQMNIEEKKNSLEKEFLSIMENIDERNISEVESKFHNEYADSVYIKGSESVFSSNKSNYIQSLRDGKIGGVRRDVQVHSVDFLDRFGFVLATLESNVMKFQSMYTFYLDQTDWKLIKAVVVAEKK
ncbi:lumazine-binding family protein [Leptospira meyeri]|uniref:lumazine-binding family protein n=1 Tax=Leptospira meyeri TaxID=29508 RepID=UPI000C2ACBD5|nr:lumazine-binding family protein [Leptospira meyeri]PKA25127.1 lumazine-binding family protein [Leptospira sp. mixed culture ATI2-C-A1]PJZ79904.1 lumazine-binding family protein [Leptospira meyeri]PJZ96138.1 lumazine-binding family protein [Leptospira meyeri]PKA14030.1 lumazine-binding family protein [Leptospira meyeri]TGM17613.1 nuclear transport factor 2 family protein [Leptospira meyeri]